MITAIAGNTTNYAIEKHIVDTPRILTIGGTIDGKIINEIYIQNIKRSDTPIVKRMTDTIMEVSVLDSSVNANIFIATI